MEQGPGSPSRLGARWLGRERCEFLVWAPQARRVDLRLLSPKEKLVPMAADGSGYHWAAVAGLEPGAEYLFRLDRKLERPDPASCWQPRGVHGPSAVADPGYAWKRPGFKGLPLESFVIYELHVGTFSPEGTFAGVIPWLDTLKGLGVTVLGLMPAAQFPGERNWGYDGVFPFAAQQSYGGPLGLKSLVDACHERGLAVMLDVVYNHLGPEGNHLRDFGPYFSSDARTPWGPAINLDGPGSDEVRRFFIENALRWAGEFRVDGLRLDAVHALRDSSARPFVEELTEAVHESARALGRRVQVIAESHLNDPRVVRPPELGGWGCDAQYSKDFHHALHTALTKERSRAYGDFAGVPDLARAFGEAFVYTGQHSRYRGRRLGRRPADRPGQQFVVFSQDHDEAGNRPRGERLSALAGLEGAKLAAAAVAWSPFIPLLFMGEEYGEAAPFLYFTSHQDRGLAAAVRQGRRRMFAGMAGLKGMPDPNAPGTFRRSKLDQSLRTVGRHAMLQDFYGRLYALRRELPALASHDRQAMEVALHEGSQCLVVRRWAGAEDAFFVLHFGRESGRLRLELAGGLWEKLLDSAQERWGGPGSPAAARLVGAPVELALAPRSVVLYGRTAS